MPEQRLGRPRGSRNVLPTNDEIRGYFKLLRDRANAGDVQAAAELIRLKREEGVKHG